MMQGQLCWFPVNGTSPVRHYSVVVVGGGQAGLSVAHALQKRGIRPVVLEKTGLGMHGINSVGIRFVW